MIRLYQRGQNTILKTPAPLPQEALSDLIWVDLLNPLVEEIVEVEQTFSINIPSRLQQEEIESSSRYTETDDYIIANSTFLHVSETNGYERIHVSFLIKGDLLVTYREGQLRSFSESVKKIKSNFKPFVNGKKILLVLFETRIDFDADLIENISHEIYRIGKQLTLENTTDAGILKEITRYQELTMQMRENIIDKQRVISSMLKSEEFADDDKERLRIIFRDINSLLDYTNFIFERLEYFQNTFLGLVNIDQNKIIKIFTIISVVFMPPTLIASIYGMNFKSMPELELNLGYPLAILLMIASSLLTLLLFRKKKWL